MKLKRKLSVDIRNDNLIIRSAIVSDAEQLTDWWNDGEVMAHAGFPKGLNQSIEKTRAQIIENEDTLSQRCIIEIDGESIGETNFRITDQIAEIGIKLCVLNYQNKGYGPKLLKMLIQYLFTDSTLRKMQPIEKIILDTNSENIRAQRTYEKIGFRKVRINHKSWQDQLGRWQSSVDYELTRENYQKRMEEYDGPL